MNTELVQLAEQSGVEAPVKNQIIENLGRFFDKASEWEQTIETIVITSPQEVGKMKMAREGRLALKNMRLEADKIVKAKRDEVKFAMNSYVLQDKLWLKAGQMVEAVFKSLETRLEEKEKFAEMWEAQQRDKLRAERLEMIAPYCENPAFYPVDIMPQNDFDQLYTGLKKAHEDRIEQQRKEAEAKLEVERLRQLHLDRMNELVPYWNYLTFEETCYDFSSYSDAEFKTILSNVIAKKEEYEFEQQAIREENERQRKAMEETQRKAEEERIAAEEQRKQLELKAEQERQERLKIEAAIKAKAEREEAERKAKEKAEKEAQKKAAAAPDKDKLMALAKQFESMELPIVKTEEAQASLEKIKELVQRMVTFINQEASKL